MTNKVMGGAAAVLTVVIGLGCSRKKQQKRPDPKPDPRTASISTAMPAGPGPGTMAAKSPPKSTAAARALLGVWVVHRHVRPGQPTPIPEIWELRANGQASHTDGYRHKKPLRWTRIDACRLRVGSAVHFMRRVGDTLHLGTAKQGAPVACPPGAALDKLLGAATAARVADQAAAEKRILRHTLPRVIPYGLRFGLAPDVVEKRFAKLEVGASTCRRRVGGSDRHIAASGASYLWDVPALPWLGLPVLDAKCVYSRKRQLDSIVLTLRNFDTSIDGSGTVEGIIKTFRRHLAGLLRVKASSGGSNATWKAHGIHVALRTKRERHEFPTQGNWEERATVTVTFTAAAGYRPAPPAPRVARLKTAPPLHAKRRPKPWPLLGIKIGQSRRKVLHRLKWLGLTAKATGIYNPKSEAPDQPPDCPKTLTCTAYRFGKGKVPGLSFGGGVAVFGGGKLHKLQLDLGWAQDPYSVAAIYIAVYRWLRPVLGKPTAKPETRESLGKFYSHDRAVAWSKDGMTLTLRTLHNSEGPRSSFQPQLVLGPAP